MHQNVSRKRLIGLSWHLHFMYFFLKKGGTLEQGAITYSANHFFSWGHVETCSRDPKEHQGTHHVKSWGGCRGTTLCSPTNLTVGEFGKGLDSVISGKKVTMQVIQVFELKRGVMSGWCGVYLEICEICCIVFVGG